MKRQLTALDAFADFLIWVKQSGQWGRLTDKDKNRIITARRDMQGKRKGQDGKTLPLGYERIKNILETYGEGRYTFNESVTINE